MASISTNIINIRRNPARKISQISEKPRNINEYIQIIKNKKTHNSNIKWIVSLREKLQRKNKLK